MNKSESGDNEAAAARRAKPQGAGSRLNPSLFISWTLLLLRSGKENIKIQNHERRGVCVDVDRGSDIFT